MKQTKRRTIKLEEVLIRRGIDHAWMIYKDHPFEETMSRPIEPELLKTLTDQEILDRFNAHIKWCDEMIATEKPREIADGYPQIEWNKEFEQWHMVADVLRCQVDWDRNGDGPRGEVAIRIDEKLLSGKEFLNMIETYEGWGMRIEFVHKENLTRRPKPIVSKGKVKPKVIPYPKFD